MSIGIGQIIIIIIILIVLFGKLPSLFNDIVIGIKKIKSTIDDIENESNPKLKEPQKDESCGESAKSSSKSSL